MSVVQVTKLLSKPVRCHMPARYLVFMVYQELINSNPDLKDMHTATFQFNPVAKELTRWDLDVITFSEFNNISPTFKVTSQESHHKDDVWLSYGRSVFSTDLIQSPQLEMGLSLYKTVTIDGGCDPIDNLRIKCEGDTIWELQDEAF